MTNATLVHAALVKLNQHTAARFVATNEAISAKLAPEALVNWCELVLEISQSGWHSWEVLNHYLEATPVLIELGGANALLQHGEFGHALLGSSTEPASRYFAGVALISDVSAFDKLSELELIGVSLKEKFPPATGLVASYYQTSFELLARDGSQNFSEWLSVTEAFVEGARADLAQLYRLAQALEYSPRWDSLAELAKFSATDTLAYLECHNRFCAMKLLEQHQLDIHRLMKKFAKSDQSNSRWLNRLCDCLPAFESESIDNLLWMIGSVSNIDLAVALFDSVEDLPLQRRNVLQPWLLEGLSLFDRNPVAGRAWFALESASSNESLEKLSGALLLADNLRVFQLFVESFLGRRLIVQAQDLGVTHPYTDGVLLKLPEILSQFTSQAENFQAYKLMLLHQLGYFEFGIFCMTEHEPSGEGLPAPARSVLYNRLRKSFVAYRNRWLAEQIFLILEHGRIDWQLTHRYPGADLTLSKLKTIELNARPSFNTADESVLGVGISPESETHTDVEQLLELLVRLTLDVNESVFNKTSSDTSSSKTSSSKTSSSKTSTSSAGSVNASEYNSYRTLANMVSSLRTKEADVSTTLACVEEIYALLQQDYPASDRIGFRINLPADVGFRGFIEPEQVMINLQLAELDDEDLELLSDELEDNEDGISLISMLAADDLDVDKLKQGELDQPGTLLTDLDEREIELDDEKKSTEEKITQGLKAALEGRIRPPHQYQFQYDEWDYVIGDYRRNWCTLHEYRVMDEDPAYVDEALSELGTTASSVRRQLNKLRPEMLVKVKGVDDGEELDIERTIELLVDRRAGVATEDRIYVEKQRKQRDVAALFLLDMSASTDDAITPEMMGGESSEAPTPGFDDTDFLHDSYEGPSLDIADSPKRKIIDVEKEAAILMAEALKSLGDQYAICGFSGYGRDNVDFYVCKDFDEPYGLQAKGKVGGIKACRSTRMGPAIRHATKMLVETGCKTKALIIISDGYPQDFDYGKDRSSKSYGIKDTTRALVEARQRDVQGFCLTVDQSGHDYLREMCPDKQYMVIQDVDQLPGELSKIYRMITG